jgi:alpha-glucosidase (family GH31 glycosyl hydrolase)
VPYEQETPEMFVRWAQFCAMGTIIRFHTNSCCDHRPWTWGSEAESAIRKILKLRYTLMPTLIAAGRRASADGTPVVQRLDLTWPELADEGAGRVISDCHFRKTATEYDRKPGIKWLSGTAK